MVIEDLHNLILQIQKYGYKPNKIFVSKSKLKELINRDMVEIDPKGIMFIKCLTDEPKLRIMTK